MGGHASPDAAQQYLDSLARAGIRLGLDTVRELARRLGEPQRAFATIHVAGTNGKGSVVAFVERALRAAGHRTGAFVSPKLREDRDQIRIDGDTVREDTFAGALLRVRGVAIEGSRRAEALRRPSERERHPPGAAPETGGGRGGVQPGDLEPTQFEALTAAALETFRASGVRIAVIEAGLGGELDATNIILPIAAAITSIGLDHTADLGTSLTSIARHKAGILKPGVPVVIGDLPSEAERTVRAVAAERGCRVVPAARDCVISSNLERGRAVIEVTTPAGRYGPVTLALRGEHQVGNALVAIRLLEEARAAGVPLAADAIERGLAEAVWPARLDVLAFEGAKRLLLDAAHNPDGAAALARYLRRFHPERPPLVFGAMHDKDVRAMLEALLPAAGVVIVTAAPTSRASDPGHLADAVRAIDAAREVVVERDPLQAVERAWTYGAMPCVAGSIALAGVVRGALEARAIVDFSS